MSDHLTWPVYVCSLPPATCRHYLPVNVTWISFAPRVPITRTLCRATPGRTTRIVYSLRNTRSSFAHQQHAAAVHYTVDIVLTPTVRLLPRIPSRNLRAPRYCHHKRGIPWTRHAVRARRIGTAAFAFAVSCLLTLISLSQLAEQWVNLPQPSNAQCLPTVISTPAPLMIIGGAADA